MRDDNGYEPSSSLDRFERALREQTAAADGLTERLRQVRGRGEGAHGLIRVEVTGGGRVTDLTLDPRVMRLASQDLRDEIMAALRQATEDADRQTRQETEDAFGTNPGWEQLLSGEAEADPSAPLPALPDMASFEEMIRNEARRRAGGV
jgi:DNA-binding protein YbaB